MYKLQLEFNTTTNYTAIDALVFALSIELYTQLRISCTQPEYDCLEFESEAHCVLAQLKLSNSSRYMIHRL